jgi:hypothetical protein
MYSGLEYKDERHQSVCACVCGGGGRDRDESQFSAVCQHGLNYLLVLETAALIKHINIGWQVIKKFKLSFFSQLTFWLPDKSILTVTVAPLWRVHLESNDTYPKEKIPVKFHSFISNLSYDRSTASSKTIPPLNAI